MKSCIIEQKPIPISWLVFAALENVAAVVQVVHALTGNGSGDTANVPMVLQPTKSVCSVQALLPAIMKFKPNLPESNWLVLLAADLEV